MQEIAVLQAYPKRIENTMFSTCIITITLRRYKFFVIMMQYYDSEGDLKPRIQAPT